LARVIFDNSLALARRVLAPACALCGDAASGDGVCMPCRRALPLLPVERCPVCAAPSPRGDPCGRCLQRPPSFDCVACALRYEYPVNALVGGLKYHGRLALARPLAAMLCEILDAEPYPDLVLPMPLSPARMAARGFNQSAEIAARVAAEFGLACDLRLARRSRDGVQQALLPWKERARNVRKAFACDRPLDGLSIAVVDDVLTTGATLNELALTLKKNGARRVTGWIAARTLPHA
jgi:ComF family protein